MLIYPSSFVSKLRETNWIAPCIFYVFSFARLIILDRLLKLFIGLLLLRHKVKIGNYPINLPY